jgi:hypothetical protein
METLHDYLKVDETILRHLSDVRGRYKKLFESPEDCQPMIIVNIPVDLPCWEERLSDPMVMLKSELDSLQPHFEISDDRVPTVRVQFGTAQPASAYGCDIYIPPNSLPAAANHVLPRIEDAFELEVPDINAGWYGKLHEWTDKWLDALPEGIEIQHPDIQSAFNTAHLVRGNDIFLDFYDNPEALDAFLSNVTDFMVKITHLLKSKISDDTEYFYDYGAMWKGTARISNCTMQLLPPDFYIEFVKKHDARFFDEIGGGRVHYCGNSREMARSFMELDNVCGCDFIEPYKDGPMDVCREIPADKVPWLLAGGRDSEMCQAILNGTFPEKRNIILNVDAPDVESGKALLNDLRQAFQK